MKYTIGFVLMVLGVGVLYKAMIGGFSLGPLVGGGILFAWGLGLFIDANREVTIATIKRVLVEELDAREVADNNDSSYRA